MRSKTADIEFAILSVVDRRMTLAELDDALYAAYPVLAGEDRRWIGCAVYNLLRGSRIRAVGCTHSSHEGYCVIEVVS